MQTLINPTIIISNPIKGKQLGYIITLNKKFPTHLSVKCESSCGRKRGVVAKISKYGEIVIIQPSLTTKLFDCINKKDIQLKLNFVLDLIYGRKRDQNCVIIKNGMTNFKRPL